MTLLHAGERKVPEIMVHQLQESSSKQLDVFESYAILPEPDTNYIRKNAQERKNAEHYIQADFARKEPLNCTVGFDIELRVKRAEGGPKFAHHEVKPPTIDGLSGEHKVSAATAVMHFHMGPAFSHGTRTA
jgi:hypothetical protein